MSIRTLILCGGKGTRAHPHTVTVPKPLLEVGGRPVVRHVMEIYASQGFTDFVLAAGYKGDLLEEFAAGLPGAWSVDVVDTGEATATGERVRRCGDRLGETFFCTYADGLGDIDLPRLLAHHRANVAAGGVATMTTVPLPSPYGTVELHEGARVARFREKPRLVEHLINAGFFVFDRVAFDHWAGDDLERDVLPALAVAGRLFAVRHDGFWRSLDTYKDAVELSALCGEGRPPWTPSGARPSS